MPLPAESRKSAEHENSEVQWLSVDELERELQFQESVELTRVFREVREEVAEDIARHRSEEAADFADAQHQIVGYDSTR